MKGGLLICIAFHYVEERYTYLKQILNRFLKTYKIPLHIVIDTNSDQTKLLLAPDFSHSIESGKLEIRVHSDLPHPHCLTWCHRFYMKEHLNDYDFFMYTEDDMDLPWENFENWAIYFQAFWPTAQPGFIRVETKDGQLYCSDQTYTRFVEQSQIICFGPKRFTRLHPEYSAMWILPQVALIGDLRDDFARWETTGHIRETAASYPTWELKKPALIELTHDFQVSPLSFIYHLPNNYAFSDAKDLGKTKVADVLRVV